MYDITFTTKAQKQLDKLPLQVAERVENALERIRIRPYPHIARLVGSPYHRLRVGDYRVILDIRDGQLLIIVIEMGKRENIYR